MAASGIGRVCPVTSVSTSWPRMAQALADPTSGQGPGTTDIGRPKPLAHLLVGLPHVSRLDQQIWLVRFGGPLACYVGTQLVPRAARNRTPAHPIPRRSSPTSRKSNHSSTEKVVCAKLLGGLGRETRENRRRSTQFGQRDAPASAGIPGPRPLRAARLT